MTNLSFEDGLRINTYSYRNDYAYNNLYSYGLFHKKAEKPYICVGGKMQDNEIMVSTSLQLGNRQLSTAKVREILDTSRVPIQIRFGDLVYYAGKGFIMDSSLQLLFVATVDGNKPIPTSMIQVKFYVSRLIYTAPYRRILPIIKEFILAHPGDVITTNNISDHIAIKVTFPEFKSIKQRKEFNEKVIAACIEKERSKYPENKDKISKTGFDLYGDPVIIPTDPVPTEGEHIVLPGLDGQQFQVVWNEPVSFNGYPVTADLGNQVIHLDGVDLPAAPLEPVLTPAELAMIDAFRNNTEIENISPVQAVPIEEEEPLNDGDGDNVLEDEDEGIIEGSPIEEDDIEF